MPDRHRTTVLALLCAFSLASVAPQHVVHAQPIAQGEWRRYNSEEYGISFRYPLSWNLHTAEAPGPLQQLFDKNQLLVCSDPANPSINFNIRLAKGPPPRPFLEEMEGTLNQVSQSLNATRLSYRGVRVADSEAAEMVISHTKYGSLLKQKMVVVSRPAVGFIWTFTAPAEQFDGVDRDVFTPVLLGITFSQPSSLQGLW